MCLCVSVRAYVCCVCLHAHTYPSTYACMHIVHAHWRASAGPVGKRANFQLGAMEAAVHKSNQKARIAKVRVSYAAIPAQSLQP